ncbi:hypothetical protein BCR33DRAFT_718764 [Rhizoclosmatium globosum]|uniref:Uncharacterized protein n=1 Tax=Rhizoclosmatium globosum TaxID=329046 RepID=A0A1Y2C5M2_9FUNG|nr:hypothetical protein BCR33DRAFT_718764 [Rhizoclosmatium globosum]|eukprot:ORY41605.1 hypothetical protein BCR33DRAFT_718764 [Rhizoclosmatium globosum]
MKTLAAASSNALIGTKTILRCKCIVLGIRTLNTEVSVKVVNIPDSNTSVELFIHDIAGHEVFLEYSTKYIAKRTRLTKGTHGTVLVANKIDLDARRIISTQQGEEFAKPTNLFDAPFYYLSNWFYDHFESSIKYSRKLTSKPQ